MTKIISAVIIILVLVGAWQLFFYWERVKNEEVQSEKNRKAAAVAGDQLPGVPYDLEQSLQNAHQQGPTGLTNWLKNFGPRIQDPRKAWIEVDYALALARENPAEARRIFASVKERLSESSPVWPRIRQLESTFR